MSAFGGKADMESSTALSANPGTQSAYRAQGAEAALWLARGDDSPIVIGRATPSHLACV